MKKVLLLFLGMMAVVGISRAQDVYSSGYYTGTNGSRNAAVYKNGEKLFEVQGLTTQSHESRSVVIDPVTNDVYWSDNCVLTSDNSFYYGNVYKNGELYLENPAGDGSHIYGLFWDPNTEEHLFAAGSVKGVETEKRYACVYCENDTTPLFAPGYDTGFASEAFGIVRTLMDGIPSTWYCGYVDESEEGDSPRAALWKDDEFLGALEVNSRFYDICFYDGSLYTIGTEEVDGLTLAKVWKDGEELYVLGNAISDSRAWNIKVDCGDVYVSGWGTVRSLCVWKNGEPLYTLSGANLRGIDVNTEGVYYTVTQSGSTTPYVSFIYKNDSILYAPESCDYLYDMCVAPVECANPQIRTLPYFEGFEMGETDWSCWTVIDEGENGSENEGLPLDSYWKRYGHDDLDSVVPATGDYCAFHRGNPYYAQEGWLVSPQLFLQPGRNSTTLSFDSYEYNLMEMFYESVWISTTDTDPDSFTEIWTQDNPSDEWTTITIDLQEYQGQAVYIAFYYSAETNGNWYIDNVSVTESWTPCGSIASYPFLDDFETELDECWYIIDDDHSGDARCWQYDASDQCVTHPGGQENTDQQGWLFTPGFELSSGVLYSLTFSTKNEGEGEDMKNSLWIALDKEGTPDPADYTMIWTEEEFNDQWQLRVIDLSEYAGHTVNFAFKYEDVGAHQWFIDNFSISEGLSQYDITVVSSNPAWGMVTGGGTYDEGATCTIHAEPFGSYVFLKWSKDGVDVSANPNYSFTVTEDATYTAEFVEPAITYFTINTLVDPEEAGVVVGGDTYPAGTTIYLTALPNAGWHFQHWNDGVTDNPRTVVVNGDVTYTATFMLNSCTITVTANPPQYGTVTGGGTYLYGETAILTATPREGYDFLIWSDGVPQAVRTVTVQQDAHYVALFTTSTTTLYTVTVLSNDNSLGYVVGGGTYPEGSEVTITATPIGSAVFDSWDDGGTKNPRQITVTSDMTFIANFSVPQMFTIRAESLDPQMGMVSGGGIYAENTEVIIQAMPFEGYYFTGWDDGSLENPRTIVVTGDAAYWAKFAVQQTQTYQVSVQCNSSQGVVVGGGTYPAGAVAVVEAIPFEDFLFDHWNDGNTDNPRSVTVNDNITLIAFFITNDVSELAEKHVTLYPNPAKGSICFSGLDNTTEVRVYNSLGMLVKSLNASADLEVDISDLASGVYFAQVRDSYLKFVVY